MRSRPARSLREYEKRLRQSNAMDFDDLLLNTIRLLENNPGVLESLQDRFKYLLVDEYQDTNRAQYRVVNMLAKKYKNLCVVGDDAQSIYRWRGADIKNILDFERDYPEATTVRLEQNYRSTKVILSAADNVIKNNAKQLKKTLWTDNVEGEKIRTAGVSRRPRGSTACCSCDQESHGHAWLRLQGRGHTVSHQRSVASS